MYRFSLDRNEQILKKGTASLHIDSEAFSGALYLTNERLVFVGYVYGVSHQSQKAISLKEIKDVKAGRTLFVLPNALDVTIDGNEHFKLIVHGRDEWLEAIRKGMAGR